MMSNNDFSLAILSPLTCALRTSVILRILGKSAGAGEVQGLRGLHARPLPRLVRGRAAHRGAALRPLHLPHHALQPHQRDGRRVQRAALGHRRPEARPTELRGRRRHQEGPRRIR